MTSYAFQNNGAKRIDVLGIPGRLLLERDTNGSGVTLYSVLSEDHKPVAYFSIHKHKGGVSACARVRTDLASLPYRLVASDMIAEVPSRHRSLLEKALYGTGYAPIGSNWASHELVRGDISKTR